MGMPSYRPYMANNLAGTKLGQVRFDTESAKLSTIETYADLGETEKFVDAVEVFAVAEPHFINGDHKRLSEAIAAGEIEAIDSEEP